MVPGSIAFLTLFPFSPGRRNVDQLINTNKVQNRNSAHCQECPLVGALCSRTSQTAQLCPVYVTLSLNRKLSVGLPSVMGEKMNDLSNSFLVGLKLK